jgi:cysteine desulfurase
VIYLDNNSTTKLDSRVLEAMMPYLTDQYANASSSHHFGKSVKKAVDNAIEEVANFVNCSVRNLVITSGATESINLAIKGLAFGTRSKRKRIVTVTTEHKAVLDTCGYLETIGFDVVYVPVDRYGLIDQARLNEAINGNTLLVSVMHANNETGVIQDIEAICSVAKSKGAFFFTDATQTVGKLAVDVERLGVDGLCFSAHKFYGPKGVGGLFLSDVAKKETQPLIHGGGHQNGLRSGTLNSPGIIGLAKACSIAAVEMYENETKIRKLRDDYEVDSLTYPGSFVNGHKEKRLYNTSNICFPGQDANMLIERLKNVAMSNGSACSSMIVEPSHVLTAMGLSEEEANASFRVSIPNGNSHVTLTTLFDNVK